ncbi:MAG: deoxyribodipyrimidine photolyase [Candidatus Entotheonellia bacterium]
MVTDEYPCFFLPRMVASAAAVFGVRVEDVDSNGLLPLRAADRAFERAYDFRRFLQRELPAHLQQAPRRNPLRTKLARLDRVPPGVVQRWPQVDARLLAGETALTNLPIDHAVSPVPFKGGPSAGEQVLRRFLEDRLVYYGEASRHPEHETTSGLSPFLHFGHVSVHQILERLSSLEKWSLRSVSDGANGKREGWWGMSRAAETFLDQLVTWRELGFNFCVYRTDYDRFVSLPGWARATLDAHRNDPRPYLYTLEQFEHAETHDDVWNAAQNQLRMEGRIHNHLRMLWGKKILHWSVYPEEALEITIELNNKYAVDGRDPNSYSGIFWTLGRYDRPWGPERNIFGTVRYMSSESARRKLRVDGYLDRWLGRTSNSSRRTR